MRMCTIADLVYSANKTKTQHGHAETVYPEASGVWEIFLPDPDTQRQYPINERVLISYLIGTKDDCIKLAEYCFGHPADPRNHQWQIRPQKIGVEGLNVSIVLYDLGLLRKRLNAALEKQPSPTSEPIGPVDSDPPTT